MHRVIVFVGVSQIKYQLLPQLRILAVHVEGVLYLFGRRYEIALCGAVTGRKIHHFGLMRVFGTEHTEQIIAAPGVRFFIDDMLQIFRKQSAFLLDVHVVGEQHLVEHVVVGRRVAARTVNVH